MLKRTSQALFTLMMITVWLCGCSNTFQGMKRDIRQATDSDTQTTVVKKTTVVNYPADLPPSPPPLQNPPQ